MVFNECREYTQPTPSHRNHIAWSMQEDGFARMARRDGERSDTQSLMLETFQFWPAKGVSPP